MDELKQRLESLLIKTDKVAEELDLVDKRHQVEVLQAHSAKPDFWKDEQEAKKTMQQLADLNAEIDDVDSFKHQIQEQLDLLVLAGEADDQRVIAEIVAAVEQLERDFTTLEVALFLTGEFDKGNALVSIHSGQGGTEAQDWAEMLKRMYSRYCDKREWKYELLHESRGEEAGIKSATLLITGRNAYGFLRHEAGTHRLVRQSPFNADSLRQTSFALVEVLPQMDEGSDIEVNDDDLEWKFSRSSGKGGQNVNKVSTAVRLTHVPTGIVVESQAERTQVQNRALALSMLKAKLWDRQEQEKQQKKQQLKGEHQPATWGTQIRSYVLHPYHLVKDLRTEVETSDAEAVLDGELDLFVEAELKLGSKD